MKEQSPRCALVETGTESVSSRVMPPELEGSLDRLLARSGDTHDDEIIALVRSINCVCARIDELAGEMRALETLAVRLAGERECEPGETRRCKSSEEGNPQTRISARERQVLTHLLGGKSNREISRELGISEKTVKNHLWKAYRKMGVKSRTQLFHQIISA